MEHTYSTFDDLSKITTSTTTSKRKQSANHLETTPLYQDPVANPFVTLDFSSSSSVVYKIFKYTICGLVLVPIRVVLTLLVFLLIVLVANVGTIGLRKDDVHDKPLARWRKVFLWPLHVFARWLLFIWGFYWIPTKGELENNSMLAPVIIGNHVSFVDGLYLFATYNGSGTSRVENGRIPVVGSLMFGTQSILIDRSSPESRKQGFQNIVKRAQNAYADTEFKPIILFPEGTTTNGTALVQFKIGAFAPGLPVQAVCMRYPNKYVDLSWPPNVSILTTILHMSFQFVNYMEVEFLPPYVPTEEEKANPQMFADNVRALMAKRINIPTTEHSYDDCKLMFEAQKLRLPETSVASLQMDPISKIFNLRVDEAKILLREFVKYDSGKKGTLTYNEFANFLKLPIDSPVVQETFDLIDQDEDGIISFKEYLLGVAAVRARSQEEIIQRSFNLFDTEKNGLVTREHFLLIMNNAFIGISQETVEGFFSEMDKDHKGGVTYEQFSEYAKKNPHYIKIAEKLIKKKEEKSVSKFEEPVEELVDLDFNV